MPPPPRKPGQDLPPRATDSDMEEVLREHQRQMAKHVPKSAPKVESEPPTGKGKGENIEFRSSSGTRFVMPLAGIAAIAGIIYTVFPKGNTERLERQNEIIILEMKQREREQRSQFEQLMERIAKLETASSLHQAQMMSCCARPR